MIIYSDGSIFEGAFKDDEPIKGRCIFRNGFVYEGDMKGHCMVSQDATALFGELEKHGDEASTEMGSDEHPSSKVVHFSMDA